MATDAPSVFRDGSILFMSCEPFFLPLWKQSYYLHFQTFAQGISEEPERLLLVTRYATYKQETPNLQLAAEDGKSGKERESK